MSWLYQRDLTRCGTTSAAAAADDDVRDAIRRVYETRDIFSILTVRLVMGARRAGGAGRAGRAGGDLLATAHPAKFAEIVEPIIGRPIEKPRPLRGRACAAKQVLRLDATLAAVTKAVGG
jgi:threonine synthase